MSDARWGIALAVLMAGTGLFGGERTVRTAAGMAIQPCIDALAASGGGVVSVPPGRHVVPGVVLRSNVELHLARGAVLEGAGRTNDYRRVVLPCSEGDWMAVVLAVGATNVAVTGEGEIYGNGTAFPQPSSYGNLQEGRRPRGLFFGNCRGVRLNGFRLRDSGSWGCVLQCCEDVEIRALTIDNHANANNDGIDLEARNAVIADCDIDSGDDAVCIKSNNPDFRTENVLVSNVTARSQCACFKIGTASHGIVRNIRFVDCRAAAPRRDFVDRRGVAGKPAGAGWFYSEWRASIMPPTRPGDLVASGGAMTVDCVDGGLVEDVSFRRITFTGVTMPIFVRGGRRRGRATGAPPGKWNVLRRITFEDVRGVSASSVPSSITGVPGLRVEDVRLRNVEVRLPGAGAAAAERTRPVPELEGAMPGPTMFEQLLPAYGLWARHVDGLTLESVKFILLDGTTDARERVVADDVTRLAERGEGR
ncbi:MAG: glycoside hydrolase family 28 protein [Kiritimatiellia bacterium]